MLPLILAWADMDVDFLSLHRKTLEDIASKAISAAFQRQNHNPTGVEIIFRVLFPVRDHSRTEQEPTTPPCFLAHCAWLNGLRHSVDKTRKGNFAFEP